MKLKPVGSNPLCRWSKDLRWPTTLRYAGMHLGMEGCGTALNATNCMRTCLYFGGPPPTFLNASCLGDIASLERHAPGDAAGTETPGVARFAKMCDPTLPTVVLENFVDGARTIEGFEFPPACNVIAGHECNGVSEAWLKRADNVVFVPQYGTISSINVVSCSGVALFYYHLSRLRQLRGATPAPLSHASTADADAFVADFGKPLPKRDDGTRVEPRPIHPVHYHRTHEEIAAAHKDHVRRMLLGRTDNLFRDRVFRIGVLYENVVDTRNLGGLIRNANSFLAPLFYFGRRKINKQGTVGSDHYTELRHLGNPLLSNTSSTDMVRAVLEQEQMELWELRLDHEPLWDLSDASLPELHRAALLHSLATPGADEVLLDCDDEDLVRYVQEARTRSPGGILLFVPQESTPPPIAVLSLKTRTLRITATRPAESLSRGMPSQVGAAIALQRLFSMLLRTR